jgi:hypothetical protein
MAMPAWAALCWRLLNTESYRHGIPACAGMTQERDIVISSYMPVIPAETEIQKLKLLK